MEGRVSDGSSILRDQYRSSVALVLWQPLALEEVASAGVPECLFGGAQRGQHVTVLAAERAAGPESRPPWDARVR